MSAATSTFTWSATRKTTRLSKSSTDSCESSDMGFRNITPPRLATRPPPLPGTCNISLHSSDLLIPVLESIMLTRIALHDARAASSCEDGYTVGRASSTLSSSTACTSATGAESDDSDDVASLVCTTTLFHAREPPCISPRDYLARVARYAFCSRAVFVGAFLYLDRIAARYPELAFNSLNVHRLLVTAVLLATKSFDDVLYDNAHFAKVGGLDLSELNALEVDFLKRLDFRMHISNDDYFMFEQKLVNTVLAGEDSEYRALRYALARLSCAPDVKRLPPSPVSIISSDFVDKETGSRDEKSKGSDIESDADVAAEELYYVR